MVTRRFCKTETILLFLRSWQQSRGTLHGLTKCLGSSSLPLQNREPRPNVPKTAIAELGELSYPSAKQDKIVSLSPVSSRAASNPEFVYPGSGLVFSEGQSLEDVGKQAKHYEGEKLRLLGSLDLGKEYSPEQLSDFNLVLIPGKAENSAQSEQILEVKEASHLLVGEGVSPSFMFQEVSGRLPKEPAITFAEPSEVEKSLGKYEGDFHCLHSGRFRRRARRRYSRWTDMVTGTPSLGLRHALFSRTGREYHG